MVRVRLPKASTRLAPERIHREVMQRARAFRIFEVTCAIVKNKRKTEDIKNTIKHLEETKLNLEIDINNKKEEDSDIEVEDEIKKSLLVNRAILIERIKYATEQFGEEQVNIGDQKELNIVETELDRLSRAGKIIRKQKDFTIESKKHRISLIIQEYDKFKKQLIELETMNVFLKRVFETSYDDEHFSDDEEEEDDDNDAVQGYNNNSNNYPDINKRMSSLNIDNNNNNSMKSKLQVPPLPERDASKFFLLSHMLDYLCNTIGFDLHGKVFYDLSGSKGYIVIAAQYCLQDGGKLTSELDNNYTGMMMNHSGSVNGLNDPSYDHSNNNSENSKFALYKLEKEKKRREALIKAEEEAEKFELEAELKDLEAEKEAERCGKITAEQIEKNEPKWPFGQGYQTEKDLFVENIEEKDINQLKKDKITPLILKEDEFYGSRPVSALTDVANIARINMAKREASKAARMEELLIRGKAFEYQKTPDPRWSRMVSYEASWDNANEAQELIDLGQPRRKSQYEMTTHGSYVQASFSEDMSSPSPHFKSNKSLSTNSPSSSVGSKSSLKSSHQKKSILNSLMDAEAHGIGSSSVKKSSSFSSSLNSPFGEHDDETSKLNSPNTPSRKDPKSLAKSLRRRKSHIEVRETDFVSAGHDWQDGDVVYFDTGSDLYQSIDEGSLIMKLEEFLIQLQPGSFAIIVSRCPYQLINEESDQLSVLMHTNRLLQGGEKISAWLVKITQPVNKK